MSSWLSAIPFGKKFPLKSTNTIKKNCVRRAKEKTQGRQPRMAPRVSHKKVAVKLALPFHQEGVMLHAVKVVLHAGAPKVAVKIQSYD